MTERATLQGDEGQGQQQSGKTNMRGMMNGDTSGLIQPTTPAGSGRMEIRGLVCMNGLPGGPDFQFQRFVRR